MQAIEVKFHPIKNNQTLNKHQLSLYWNLKSVLE